MKASFCPNCGFIVASSGRWSQEFMSGQCYCNQYYLLRIDVLIMDLSEQDIQDHLDWEQEFSERIK